MAALMGTAEVAERLGVDRVTVQRWVKAGRLIAAQRLGDGPTSAYLFDSAAVDALANELADEAEARAAQLREAVS